MGASASWRDPHGPAWKPGSLVEIRGPEMATLLARLISPERIAFAWAGATCVHPGPGQPDQKLSSLSSSSPSCGSGPLKGVSGNRRAEGGSTHCAVLPFARSVWTTLTGAGHRLGQGLNRALLGGRVSMIQTEGREQGMGLRTLVLVACILAASPLAAGAVELINPH